MRLTDIDNDGDLDVLFPNANGLFANQGPAEPFVVYRNDGAFSFMNVSTEAVGNGTGFIREVAVADISGDGFVDIYAPSAWGEADKFFINDGTGKFNDEAASRLPNVSSRAGAARFGDIDNDGDLDLLVGDDYSELDGGVVVHIYLNDGMGKFTETLNDLPLAAAGTQPVDFDLLDIDGDFDLDLLIDMHNGPRNLLWQNDGTGKFTDLTMSNLPTQPGLNYGPVTCDVDGDGDLDIWTDNAAAGYNEQLLINDGSGKFSDETAARVTGNDGGNDDNGLACIDADGDGDFDAVIFNLGAAERLLLNDGTGKFTIEGGAFPSSNDSTLWIEFGDLDNDGRLDFASAQGESSTLDKVFAGIAPLPVDTVAPKIRAVEAVATPTPSDSPVVRFAVSDNATTDEGPRLQKAYLKITAPSASEIKAVFMGGDMFRAVLPAEAGGTAVSFEACAKDRQGNEGCSKAFSYTVSGSGPATTGSGGGGNGGSGGAGGGGTGANAGTGGAGGTDGTGGKGGGGGLALEEGGCGCTVPGGGSSSPGSITLAIAGALTALARRRRRSHAQG